MWPPARCPADPPILQIPPILWILPVPLVPPNRECCRCRRTLGPPDLLGYPHPHTVLDRVGDLVRTDRCGVMAVTFLAVGNSSGVVTAGFRMNDGIPPNPAPTV